MQIDLQADYILVLWEHWDNWSNDFVRWCYKNGYRNEIINELLLDEVWNIHQVKFDPDRYLRNIYHGLVTDAVKVSGIELSTLSKQFFPGGNDAEIGFLELLDKIACEYVLTGKQQSSGKFYQEEYRDLAVIHTFGIDLNWETFPNDDFAGVVTILAFPAKDLFERCSLEESISLIDEYIDNPEKAHSAHRTQGRLNGLRERLTMAARLAVLTGQTKAADTSCQLADDIDRNNTPAGRPDTAHAVGGIADNTGPEEGSLLEKYQQTAQALILETVKPLLKYIKGIKKYKDNWKTYFEKSVSNISQIKKQGVRIDGNNWFFEKDGVRYGYCSQGCWVQNGSGTTHYILIESKFKEFYEELSDIAEKLKNLS